MLRSRGLETAVLGKWLSGDTPARGMKKRGGYRSRGLERTVLETELPGDTATGGYRSRELSK